MFAASISNFQHLLSENFRKISKISNLGVEKFECELCHKSFANLKKHHETVHEGLKPYECTLCDQKFSRNNHLERHIKLGEIHK